MLRSSASMPSRGSSAGRVGRAEAREGRSGGGIDLRRLPEKLASFENVGGRRAGVVADACIDAAQDRLAVKNVRLRVAASELHGLFEIRFGLGVLPLPRFRHAELRVRRRARRIRFQRRVEERLRFVEMRRVRVHEQICKRHQLSVAR